MSAAKKTSPKVNSKINSAKRQRRRKWLTFVRMCRYGTNNFSRNAWLTVAATAVMTITLLIIFMTLASRIILVDTVDKIRDNIEMSIYVKSDISEKNKDQILLDLKALSSVKSVDFITAEQARADFAKKKIKDRQTIDALEALNDEKGSVINPFPAIFRIKVENVNDSSQLKEFVQTNQTFKNNRDKSNREPSFQTSKQKSIDNIGRWVGFAEKAGILASVVFIVISSLIVFNTIRMAIFNRKDEIEMMKLIGAEKSFIRGPFLVEAVVYGVIAAILATVIGILLISLSSTKLTDYGVVIGPILDFVITYVSFIVIAMMLIGAFIGVVSSFLATRRYLKI